MRTASDGMVLPWSGQRTGGALCGRLRSARGGSQSVWKGMMSDSHVWSVLRGLIECHSTPGDEGRCAERLSAHWVRAGLEVTRHGRYAVSARRGGRPRGKAPLLLVCAHLDSPGYIVERLEGDRAKLIPLGAPRFDGDETPGWLRSGSVPHEVTLRRQQQDDADDEFWIDDVPAGVRHGDRLCFRADAGLTPTGEIRAPFLDNRLGCAVLACLAEAVAESDGPWETVLGATACEEMGGFGAPVLARAVGPDAVICLDATYEAPEQNVTLGGGPVLTVSDASVVLSPGMRDRLAEWFSARGLSLQTEVYNVSGTDARAFPHQGLACTVLPLLLPTRGNHRPREEAVLGDLEGLVSALRHWLLSPPDLFGM